MSPDKQHNLPKKRILIANWKMNLSLDEASLLCNKLSSRGSILNIIIAPPTPYLAFLAQKYKDLKFAAQNISHITGPGNYTGEYGGSMISSCRAGYCIAGHSERRKYLAETDDIIKTKATNALESNIIPIICFDGDAGTAKISDIEEKLLALLPSIDGEIIIAFEPTCNIGSGIKSDIGFIKNAIKNIKQAFDSLRKREEILAKNIKLVYGGSVDDGNVLDILSGSSLDGVMVGKASLDFEILSKILDLLETDD